MVNSCNMINFQSTLLTVHNIPMSFCGERKRNIYRKLAAGFHQSCLDPEPGFELLLLPMVEFIM